MITIISTKEDQDNDFNSMILKIFKGTLSDEETQKFLEETGIRILDKRECERVLDFIRDIPELKNLRSIIDGIVIIEREGYDIEIPYVKDEIRIVQHKNGLYETWAKRDETILQVLFMINQNNKICLSSICNKTSGYDEIYEVIGSKLTQEIKGRFVLEVAKNKNARMLTHMLNMNEQDLTPCDSSAYDKVAKFFSHGLQEILNQTSTQHFFKKISNDQNAYLVKLDGLDIAFMTIDDEFIYVLRFMNILNTYVLYIKEVEPQLIMSKELSCSALNKTEKMLDKYFFSLLLECNRIAYEFNNKHKIDGFERQKSFTPIKMTHEELLQLSETGDLQERDIITK